MTQVWPNISEYRFLFTKSTQVEVNVLCRKPIQSLFSPKKITQMLLPTTHLWKY